MVTNVSARNNYFYKKCKQNNNLIQSLVIGYNGRLWILTVIKESIAAS